METMETELAEAAREGDLDTVRRLVETKGVNPSCIAGDERKTPLHVASGNGQIDVVRYLIEEAGVNASFVDKFGNNALHLACLHLAGVHHRGLPTVQYLVEQVGLSIEKRTGNGDTALICLCYGHTSGRRSGNRPEQDRLEQDRLKIARYLVENQGADVDARNRGGFTPLRLACITALPEDFILYLLQKAQSFDEQALEEAWKGGSWNVIEAALRKYAAVGCCYIDENAYELNPIHSILEHFPLPDIWDYESCIKRLWSTRTPLLLDKQGRFPVHVALTSSNTIVREASIISMLVDMEPKSALARDPTTGLYPYESVGLLDPTEFGGVDVWLNVTFMLFRSDPTKFLQTRKLVTSKVEEEQQKEEETPKRLRLS